MADGISMDGGSVRQAAGVGARVPVPERPAQPAADARPATPVSAAQSVTIPADAIALGQARDRIAAVLADVNTRPATVMPLSPGAGDEAIAAAQALVQLIAANARPAIAAQARVSPQAVRMVLDR